VLVSVNQLIECRKRDRLLVEHVGQQVPRGQGNAKGRELDDDQADVHLCEVHEQLRLLKIL
jgi:hypothetical protein